MPRATAPDAAGHSEARLQVQVLAGLANGETFDYQTLVTAATTLESLLSKEPSAAKVAEDDRRGSGR